MSCFPSHPEEKPRSLQWPVRPSILRSPQLSNLSPNYLPPCALHSSRSDLLALPWKHLASSHLKPSHFTLPSTQNVLSCLSMAPCLTSFRFLLMSPAHWSLLWPTFLKQHHPFLWLSLSLSLPPFVTFFFSRAGSAMKEKFWMAALTAAFRVPISMPGT